MPERRSIICCDAGHGGSDPGAVGPSGLREADVTLKITQQVAKLLGERGAIVILTRGGDKDVSLQDRAKFANDGNADVFVSIHCNAATNPAAHGLEAFYFEGSGAGKRLAEAMLERLVAETGLANRGVKAARFAVLRLTDMPAALVECGFISNPTEEDLLQRENFQQECARAIADGIAAYLGLKEGKDVSQDVKIERQITVQVEDKEFKGYLINGQTYAPVRQLVEALNNKVNWDDMAGKVVVERA